MNVELQLCKMEELEALCELSTRAFRETFAKHNDPKDLQAYLDKAFSAEKLREELSNECSTFYFLYADGDLAGYLKLNEGQAQTEFRGEHALEIERIYILQAYHGRGLGGRLMEKAVSDVYKRQVRHRCRLE